MSFMSGEVFSVLKGVGLGLLDQAKVYVLSAHRSQQKRFKDFPIQVPCDAKLATS